jgi:gas vesicle protein
MGEDPDRIRREIEQTRAEMSETVDALSYKADVKSRAKESLQEKRDSAKESVVGATQTVKEKLVGAKDSVSDTAGGATSRVGDATPDREQVKHQARRAKGVAQENPIGLAIGSIAVGFIAGMLVPASRVEDEKLGAISDQVVDKAKETGQEALQHGKQVAQETAQSAQETLKDSAQQHGEQVKETAQDNAQEVRQQQASPSSI